MNKAIKIDFLIFEAKKTFIHLQKTFIKALILKYFDSKYYIYIETNALGFVKKIILAKMQSKIYN